jgi:gliding motility-associated-like protein
MGLSISSLHAQRESWHWTFGDYAHIEFSSGAPLNTTNHQMSTLEGCATISDKATGSMLFYTDGGTVWNANNVAMTNGTGLMGNLSATQSGIIVPKPGSSTNYYIFTVPSNPNNGLRYSEVDMSQSSGLGSVLTTNKNTLLLNPVADKVTAIAHANGTDIWVLAQHNTNWNIYAYLVTSTGVNTTPTITTVTPPTGVGTVGHGGAIKASPDGNWVAFGVAWDYTMMLFDFDNSTGTLSNAITQHKANNSNYNPFGIEFSKNSQVLYVTDWFGPSVYQYDLSQTTSAGILASETNVNSNGTLPIEALQLAIDDKIYCSRMTNGWTGTNWLARINNPDVVGTGCNYVDQAFQLATGATGRMGLPNFIQSFFISRNIIIQDTCQNDTTKFSLTTTQQLDSIFWNFGDPGSGALNTDTSVSPTHIYPDTGEYYIEVIVHARNAQNQTRIDTLYDTLRIHPIPVLDLGPDTTLCNLDSLEFSINTSLYDVIWSDSSTGNKLEIDTPGTYWIYVENVCGSMYDTVVVDSLWPDSVYLGPDTVVCLGDTVNFDVETVTGSTYLWQDGSTLPTFTVDTVGYYSVQVSNVCGTFSDVVHVDYERPPTADLGNDTTICDGVILVKNAVFSRSTYLWQNGSQSSLMNIFSPGGTYWVEVTNQCGVASDTLEVAYDYPLNLDLGPDSVICVGDTVLLDPGNTIGGNYTWWSGSRDSTELASLAGTYWVRVVNTCGTYTDTVEHENERVPIVQLPEDTVFCIGNSIDLKVQFSRSTYRWSNGSTDTTINVSTAGKTWAEASNICGIVSDTIEIFIDEPLVVDLGPDTTLCNTNTLSLDVTAPNNPTYWWNIGVSSPRYTIVETGVYRVSIMNTCGTYEDEIRVVYEYTPDIWLGPDTTICEGRSFRIALPPLQNADVTWSDGSKFDVIEVNEPGVYSVQATNICGTGFDEIEVYYSQNPRFNLGEDRLICPGENVELTAFIDDGGSYSYWWNTDEFHPTIFVSSPGDYGVSVENEFGCVSTDTVSLLLCDQYVYIPSAFTPNLDGLNEEFKIYGERLSEVDVVITNRWGERVYEANRAQFAWDGTYRGEPCEIGVYTYQITYPDLNNQLQIRTGTFTLLR